MRLTKLRVLYNHHSSEGKDADQRLTYSSDLTAVWSMESARPTGSIRPFSSSLAASSWNETKGEKKRRRIWCEWHSKSTRRLEPESLLHKQINLKHSAQPPDYKCEVDESCFSSRTEWCPYDCWQHTPMTKCLQDETAYTIFQFLLPANELVDSHSHYLCFTEKWCCQQATQHFLPLQLVHMSHWALVLGHELANVHVSWTQSKKRMVSHRPPRCAAMIQQEVFKTDFRDQECITGVSTCWKCVKLENRTSVISSGPSVVS